MFVHVSHYGTLLLELHTDMAYFLCELLQCDVLLILVRKLKITNIIYFQIYFLCELFYVILLGIAIITNFTLKWLISFINYNLLFSFYSFLKNCGLQFNQINLIIFTKRKQMLGYFGSLLYQSLEIRRLYCVLWSVGKAMQSFHYDLTTWRLTLGESVI